MRLRGRRHWTQTVEFGRFTLEETGGGIDPLTGEGDPLTSEKVWTEHEGAANLLASVQSLDREELVEFGLTLEQQHFFVRTQYVPGLSVGDGVQWLGNTYTIEVINGIPNEDTEIIMRR